MGEVNWIASLLIGVIISIPIGILTNILTPIIQDKIEKATLSTQTKKLERLRREFNTVQELHETPNLFLTTLAKNLISALRTILLSIAIIFIVLGFFILNEYFEVNIRSLVVLIAIYFLVVFGEYNQAGKFTDTILRLLNYEKYKVDIASQISELEKINKENKKSRRKP
ncbi:MAG: hypothetical protein QY328_17185 [Anaerolineales bacterium]|nr:MAG: hypothetical protein QY328_17185 [Anaerolineales bacterium]